MQGLERLHKADRWRCECNHWNGIHPHICRRCGEMRPENCPECESAKLEVMAINEERDRHCLNCDAAFSSAYDYGIVEGDWTTGSHFFGG